MQLITDAFNAHDLDAIMEFFADDCSLDMPRGTWRRGVGLIGKAAVREGFAARFKGLPDVHYGEGRHWVSSNRGASEWLLTSHPPDGRRVRVQAATSGSFETGESDSERLVWKIVDGTAWYY